MKMIKTHQWLLTAMAVVALMSLFAFDVQAAENISSKADDWKEQLNAIIGLGTTVFVVCGFFLFAGGLFYFYKDNKQPGQGHLKTGVVALLVGTGLMIISWLLGTFTESVAEGEGSRAQDLTSDF